MTEAAIPIDAEPKLMHIHMKIVYALKWRFPSNSLEVIVAVICNIFHMFGKGCLFWNLARYIWFYITSFVVPALST